MDFREESERDRRRRTTVAEKTIRNVAGKFNNAIAEEEEEGSVDATANSRKRKEFAEEARI